MRPAIVGLGALIFSTLRLLAMATSSARLYANRLNASKSTGPKTAAGKAQSRRNSLKHGLTGDGVVMVEEDANAVARRFETLKAEMQPSGEAGRVLLRRFAYLSVRLEKSEEFEISTTAKRVRHAVEDFDDFRRTELETLASCLNSDPMTVARRLQNSVEGVDWLVKHWLELREDLMARDQKSWTLNHWGQMERLLGRPVGNIRMTRAYALTQALHGYFAYLDDQDGAGLDEAERMEWARGEMAALIDGELTRLGEVKAALDPASIELDRSEAPSRALFDPSPEMNLARKYEAATERAMYKALDRFYDVELAALEGEPVAASSIEAEPLETLGSFLPESSPDEAMPVEPPGTAPRSVYLPNPLPSHRIAAQPSSKKRPRIETKRDRNRASRNEARVLVS